MLYSFMETVKFIAELITTISAAYIVLAKAFNALPTPIKHFLTKTIPTFFSVFFRGVTKSNGEKTRFFQAIKEYRKQNEQWKNITQTLSRDLEMEEALILDKKALLDILSKSEVFHKISIRKQ